jgi:hypothetical protein
MHPPTISRALVNDKLGPQHAMPTAIAVSSLHRDQRKLFLALTIVKATPAELSVQGEKKTLSLYVGLHWPY